MTFIQRTVVLNPVEPQPMSIRAPSGMPLKIAILYKDIYGNNLTDDVAALIQLTSRSENRTLTYAAPATDIVNGKAVISIPEGDLDDMNGYRLRLMGTYKQEPTLIAMGLLSLVQGAGDYAVPEDVIDNVPISMVYNFDTSITVRLWKDAGKMAPFDLSTALITAATYTDQTEMVVTATFTITKTQTPGEVILSMPAATVNTLYPGGWWSLRASNVAGITTLCQGAVTITGTKP